MPPTIPPGEHRIVLVIDAEVTPNQVRQSLDSPLLGCESWSENVSLQREEGDENKEARLREILEICDRISNLPILDNRTPEEILGYNEFGITASKETFSCTR